MSKPLVSHYMRVSRKIDTELSKLTWSDYVNCPNIEYLVKFAVLNNININRDLCKDPLKWQSGLKKEQSYKNNEKNKLFKRFSKNY